MASRGAHPTEGACSRNSGKFEVLVVGWVALRDEKTGEFGKTSNLAVVLVVSAGWCAKIGGPSRCTPKVGRLLGTLAKLLILPWWAG